VKRCLLPQRGGRGKLATEMKRALALLVLVACGDNDIGSDAAVLTEVMPECHDIQQTDADPFLTPESVDKVAQSPAVRGSLANWEPDGRWFLTGTRVGGVSSFHFQRMGNEVIVDRETNHPGNMTNTTVFQRTKAVSGKIEYQIIKRVSNLAPDGTLRAERIACDGSTCRVCTAKLVRAERNTGEGEGDHLTLVGQLNDPAWAQVYTLNVRVDGMTAYLIRRDGLHIIDVADPANPTELGFWGRSMRSGSANDVKIVHFSSKVYALIGDVPVDIVDVTIPSSPVLAGQIPEEAHTLAVESRDNKVYAYFGNYDGRCPIYDVTNPAQPMKLGSIGFVTSLIHDLSIENGIAYLNAWDAGFIIVDYTDPHVPQMVSQWVPTPTGTSHSSWPTTVGSRHIALHGDENYGAHLDIVDIDPASPQYMTSIGTYQTRPHVSIHNVMAFGSKAYFSYYQDGVRVMDLSDPTKPTLIGYYNTWDPQADYTSSQFYEGAVGIDVDLARKLIFVADSPRGLLILSDATP
jgi:hypothetical protein